MGECECCDACDEKIARLALAAGLPATAEVGEVETVIRGRTDSLAFAAHALVKAEARIAALTRVAEAAAKVVEYVKVTTEAERVAHGLDDKFTPLNLELGDLCEDVWALRTALAGLAKEGT